jgi:hypothetical protein
MVSGGFEHIVRIKVVGRFNICVMGLSEQYLNSLDKVHRAEPYEMFGMPCVCRT